MKSFDEWYDFFRKNEDIFVTGEGMSRTVRLEMPDGPMYSKQYIGDVRELCNYEITVDDFYARWDVLIDGEQKTYKGQVPTISGFYIKDRLESMRAVALKELLGW